MDQEATADLRTFTESEFGLVAKVVSIQPLAQSVAL